jgi:Sec-independent protein translocase protein TatA
VFVFTLIVLAAVLLLFGAERLLGPMLGPML